MIVPTTQWRSNSWITFLIPYLRRCIRASPLCVLVPVVDVTVDSAPMTVNSGSQIPSGAESAGLKAFQPFDLGSITVRNRIFVPAHTTNFGLDNLPTDRHTAYHEARARGGVGLIIMESLRVHPTSLGKPQGVAAYDPRCVGPLTRIAEAVHGHGAKVFGQIIHLGRQIDGDALRLPSWGPSPIAWDATSPAPHVMTMSDVAEVVDGHVTSARNVLAAGFDGLEIHVGHGHLLQQFLSPATNTRTDEYGGSEANRCRFAVEVLRAVRDAVGPETCVGIRISADEYAPGGLVLDDMQRIVCRLADLVALDFVNVSHSAYHGSYSLSTQMADMSFPATTFRHLAPAIKAALIADGHDLPVMAVCKFRTIEEAEEALETGGADLIGMARAHVADPDLVAKARRGRVAETRTCVGCNQGCAGFLEKGLPITCVVNPTVGVERTWTPDPVDDPAPLAKRVVVIGGGPAGMEAAWVAAARGHQVQLVEQSTQLGGQLRWVEHLPKRRDFLHLIEEQEAACDRHGVDVQLNTRLSDDDVAEMTARDPDLHVVVATGATIPAFDFPNGGSALTPIEVLGRSWTVGDTVAFHDLGGDWTSLGLVEYLADLGVSVVYTTPVAGYGWKITRYSKTALTARLRQAGVAIRPLRAAQSYLDGVFTVEDLSTGELEHLVVDQVVAVGNPVADSLVRSADAGGSRGRVQAIGDCLAPRSALEAVYEGHRVAREL
jgi:2,4-dienoyl-CoA reductase-like NADH-dependent reductase (Old Yellow Enzyme family)